LLAGGSRALDIPRVPLVPLFGHDALRRRLAESAARSALPGSLLIAGRRGIGKQRLALWLGQLLLCTGEGERPCGKCASCRYSAELVHPDLRWFFPRPRLASADPTAQEILDDQAEAIRARVTDFGLYPPPSGTDAIFVATVRALVQFAAYSPSIARRKVIVVGDAERMVPQEGADQAANAFLKLLEEPPADTTIILTSSEPGSLLPTIRSRVVTVRVAPVPDSAVAGFLHDPHVSKALSQLDLPESEDERIAIAAGAPGTLLGVTASGEAMKIAKSMLDAAAGSRADRIRAAFALSSAGARGGFSELLDALTVALHTRIRDASTTGEGSAGERAGRAIDLVEGAKLRASGNVNPQLIASAMIRAMSEL
jgi:DNA polymerase III subunit delta'